MTPLENIKNQRSKENMVFAHFLPLYSPRSAGSHLANAAMPPHDGGQPPCAGPARGSLTRLGGGGGRPTGSTGSSGGYIMNSAKKGALLGKKTEKTSKKLKNRKIKKPYINVVRD